MFPKIGVNPPNHPFVHRVFHYKPSILGYHYFWKHPYWHMSNCYLFKHELRDRKKNPKTKHWKQFPSHGSLMLICILVTQTVANPAGTSWHGHTDLLVENFPAWHRTCECCFHPKKTTAVYCGYGLWFVFGIQTINLGGNQSAFLGQNLVVCPSPTSL